jgi:DNA-binding Lrp family transcriptional regulator
MDPSTSPWSTTGSATFRCCRARMPNWRDAWAGPKPRSSNVCKRSPPRRPVPHRRDLPSACVGLEHAGRGIGAGKPDRGGGADHQRLCRSQPQLRARARFNLWFVATAPSRERVAAVLAEIGQAAAARCSICRCWRTFISIWASTWIPDSRAGTRRPHQDPSRRAHEAAAPPALERADHALAAALEGGITLSPRPYAVLAARLGCGEDAVIARLKRLLKLGVMRRFGVVVRHRELGYSANAMVVWDVPDADVSEVGRLLASQSAVTLCYRRPRRLAGLALQPVLDGAWTGSPSGIGGNRPDAQHAGPRTPAFRAAVLPPPLQAMRRALLAAESAGNRN